MLAVELGLERRASRRGRRSSGGTPSCGGCALDQVVALLLELGARDHLALQLGQLHEHALDVLLADRRGLLDHDPEQPARRLDLLVEVAER